jgi:hypothetical protein
MVKIDAWKDIEMLKDILTELDKGYQDGSDKVATDIARNLTQSALARWESEADSLMEMPGVEDICPETVPLPDSDEMDLEPKGPTIPLSDSPPSPDATLLEMEATITRMMQRMDVEEEAHLRSAVDRLTLRTFSSTPHPSTPTRCILRPYPPLTSRLSIPRSSSRSIRFSDVATITSDPSSPTPLQQPHNIHTSADMKRHRNLFNRFHASYMPNTWSSPEGFEKVETSWFNKDLETILSELEDTNSGEEGGLEEGQV